MKIKCYAPPWGNHIEVLICERHDNGQRFIAEPVTMREAPDHLAISTPTLTMERTEAQVLMDSLWDCGIRPTEGAGSAGAMAATERHLADMRKLVFCANPFPKPAESMPAAGITDPRIAP
jgi:hypothetical protein